jgi:hypothetical protein
VTTPQQEGRDFETDLAVAFGVDVTPGSGNQWHSKLDLKGKGVRISAKASRKHVVVDNDLIDEAVIGCDDGTIPLWAFRIPAGDFIMLDIDDFKSFMAGEIEFDIPHTKSEERKARARVPQLLRGD